MHVISDLPLDSHNKSSAKFSCYTYLMVLTMHTWMVPLPLVPQDQTLMPPTPLLQPSQTMMSSWIPPPPPQKLEALLPPWKLPPHPWTVMSPPQTVLLEYSWITLNIPPIIVPLTYLYQSNKTINLRSNIFWNQLFIAGCSH